MRMNDYMIESNYVFACIRFVEVMTYSCFCELMKRMAANFPHGGAMDEHFANMRSLIQVGALRFTNDNTDHSLKMS